MAGMLAFALSTLLPSVLAINDLLPNHAVPEMAVLPPNTTLMTPRSKKPRLERQLFDFGSAEHGFTELKRIAGRQTACSLGYMNCLTDASVCCPIGGDCCASGNCCGAGRWCYGATKCCLVTQIGCDNQVMIVFQLNDTSSPNTIF